MGGLWLSLASVIVTVCFVEKSVNLLASSSWDKPLNCFWSCTDVSDYFDTLLFCLSNRSSLIWKCNHLTSQHFSFVLHHRFLTFQCSCFTFHISSVYQGAFCYHYSLLRCMFFNQNLDTGSNKNARNGSYFTWLNYLKWGRCMHTVHNLLFRHGGLILNKFRIYKRWHIRRRKPRQLSDWMKNSSYYIAMADIRTSHTTWPRWHE